MTSSAITYAEYSTQAACLPVGQRQLRQHEPMAKMQAGPGRRPRGGIMRTRTTVRLRPKDYEAIEKFAEELGLTLTDTLAYFINKGAGLPIPPDIQMIMDHHKEAVAAGEIMPNQDPLVA